MLKINIVFYVFQLLVSPFHSLWKKLLEFCHLNIYPSLDVNDPIVKDQDKNAAFSDSTDISFWNTFR